MQEIFPNVKEVIKEDSNDLKEKIDDLNEILDKTGKGEDEDDQKLFEFGFFTGDNLEFLDFLQSDFCKEILESNDLKIHIETGSITTKILTLSNQFLNSLKINRILQRAI